MPGIMPAMISCTGTGMPMTRRPKPVMIKKIAPISSFLKNQYEFAQTRRKIQRNRKKTIREGLYEKPVSSLKSRAIVIEEKPIMKTSA